MSLRGRLGPCAQNLKQVTLLNRVIIWVDGQCIELDVGPRQSERLVTQLGLEGASLLSMPDLKVPAEEFGDDEPVHNSRASVCRGAIARANYLSQDHR